MWTIDLRSSAAAQVGRSAPGKLLVEPAATAGDDASGVPSAVQARVVVNAAGLYGDIVDSWRPAAPGLGAASTCSPAAVPMGNASANVPEGAPFHVTPRKGQFLVLRPAGDGTLMPEIVIEQVATHQSSVATGTRLTQDIFSPTDGADLETKDTGLVSSASSASWSSASAGVSSSALTTSECFVSLSAKAAASAALVIRTARACACNTAALAAVALASTSWSDLAWPRPSASCCAAALAAPRHRRVGHAHAPLRLRRLR